MESAPRLPLSAASIASLVFGVLAVVLFPFTIISVPSGAAAVVFGVIGVRRGNAGTVFGGWLGVAGIALGAIAMVFGFLIAPFVLYGTRTIG